MLTGTAHVIHPSAILSPETKLGEGVKVGPYCIIEGDVTLGPGVELISHVCIRGPVTIGANTRLYPGACIGFEPQDYKFKPGSRTAGVVIGKDCLIREHVTVHASTKEELPTRVGDRCFLMGTTHLAHDVKIGNDVVLVNMTGIAGHSEIADNVTMSGAVIVHQFTRVGRHAFLSGGVGVSMDVPPFCVVAERNRLGGVNLVGMRRAGFNRDDITLVRRAFREVLRVPTLTKQEMVEKLETLGRDSAPVREMAAFIAEPNRRAICPGPARPPRLFTTFLHLGRRGKSDLQASILGAADDE
jgi:UDP-N-acetylglucosamine acyltransferase